MSSFIDATRLQNGYIDRLLWLRSKAIVKAGKTTDVTAIKMVMSITILETSRLCLKISTSVMSVSRMLMANRNQYV